MRVQLLIGALAVVGIASACGEDKSVLDEGVQLRTTTHVISSAESLTDARRRLTYWRSELRKRAQADPKTRFKNLDPDVLPAAHLEGGFPV